MRHPAAARICSVRDKPLQFGASLSTVSQSAVLIPHLASPLACKPLVCYPTPSHLINATCPGRRGYGRGLLEYNLQEDVTTAGIQDIGMKGAPETLLDHMTAAAATASPGTHLMPLLQSLGSSYQQDPSSTTATLAQALHLAAKEEGTAQAAAEALTTALTMQGMPGGYVGVCVLCNADPPVHEGGVPQPQEH
jgi:hypothetical protein